MQHNHGLHTSSETTGNAAVPSVWTGTRALKTWVCGGFFLCGLLLTFTVPSADVSLGTIAVRPLLLSDLLYLLAIGAGGQVILKNGYRSLVRFSLDMNLLMSLAILGAAVVGLFVEGATLAFLFNIAELLEDFSVEKARRSIRELMTFAPDRATVIRDGEEKTVPVDEVEVGETIVVRPGQKIAMDGIVMEGESAVDESPITGESIPLDKFEGDRVYAGTLNKQGYLEVEVTTSASENTLQKIIELVEGAREKKTRRETFVERFSSVYTPVVFAGAILGLFVPPLLFGQAWMTAVHHSITLLVLACPCAFVIATPVAVVSAVTAAARNGVLIKGGRYLESMGEINAVAFDKTGTLTRGRLEITDVIPLSDNTRKDVLRCARGIEQKSEHPIADAIVNHAEEAGVPGRSADNFESITGKGVRAELDGTLHFAGKPGLFRGFDFDLEHVHHSSDRERIMDEARRICHREDCLNVIEETIPRLQNEGKTVILVSTETELEGIIAVADEVREEAAEAVRALKNLGLEKLVLISGDNQNTATAIANRIGIAEAHGELLPDEKVEMIESIRREHGPVAMVGDGVNDAPALATADVGVSMGVEGTDVAIESSDVALMSESLERLPYLYDLAVRSGSVIRQNIGASLGVKALLVVGVPVPFIPVTPALAILAGDAGMTAAVTTNATRLRHETV